MRRRTNQTEPLLPPKIGDFVYSDGKWSSVINQQKECVGICYYANGNDRRMVAVKDVGQSKTNYDILKYITNPANIQTRDGAIKDLNGKSNTEKLKAHFQQYNIYKQGYFIYDALNYKAGIFGVGTWWAPSMGELSIMADNRPLMDKNFLLAGGKAFSYGNRDIYSYCSTTPYNYTASNGRYQYFWCINYKDAATHVIEVRGSGGEWFLRTVTAF